MSTYFKLGSLIEGLSTTVTTGGNTTLTASSRPIQQFTGTSTQTVTLPDATTLPLNRRFDINNRSTGIVTVNANGGGLIATVPAGSQRYFLVTDVSSAPGIWQVGGVTGAGGATVSTTDKLNLLTGLAGVNASTDNIESRVLKFNPEELAGNYWTTKVPVAVAKCWPTNFTLNGYVYNAFGINNSSVNTVTNERYDTDNNYFLSRANGIVAANTRAPFVLLGLGYAVNGDPSINAVEAYNDAANTWASKTAIGTAFYGAASWALNGLGYVAGGQGSGTTSFVYDPSLNAWYPRVAVSPSMSRVGQGDSTYNGFGYIVCHTGGSTDVLRFNEVSNSYTAVANTTNQHALGGVSVVAGAIFIAGGENGGGTPIQTTEKFYDITNVWQAMSPYAGTARYLCGAQFAGVAMAISNGPGTTLAVTTVESYAATALLPIGSLKRTTAAPTSILASILVNAISNNLPVQVRTDGDNWKSFSSGSDSVLKTGEALTTKFVESHQLMAAGGDGVSATESWQYTTNTWQTRQPMITARGGGFQFKIDGYGYVGGAGATNLLNERFNDFSNSWTSRAPLLAARQRTMGHTLNGFGYVYSNAGTNTNNQQKYNPTSDSWSIPASTYTNANGYSLGYSLLGFGYIIGGDASGSSSTDNRQYNDIADTFTNKAAVPYGVQQGGSATFDTRGYIVGGFTGGDISTVSAYDPNTNSWTTKASLGSASRAQRCDVVNGLIYSFGGLNSPTSVFRYNPYTDSWSGSLTAMSTSHDYVMAPMGGFYRNYEVRIGIPAYYAGVGSTVWTTLPSILDGISVGPNGGYLNGVYRYAGYNGSSIVKPNGYYYNPNSRVWVAAASMPTAQAGSAFVLKEYLYAVDQQGALSSLVQRYSDISGVWTSTTSTNSNRIRIVPNGACALNGFGYILGGGTQATSAAEQWNDSALTWTTKTSRSNTFTAYCANGSIGGFFYSVGGSDNGSSQVATVEQYDDASNVFTNKTAFPVSIDAVSTLIFNDNMYIANGSLPAYTAVTRRYSQGTDTWITQQSSTLARAFGCGMFDINVAGQNGGGDTTAVDQLVSSFKNAVLGMALEVK